MATTAPAKCFFGSISKHNQCSRPTYVWMYILYIEFQAGGLWRQKRRPKVSSDLCKHTHNQCGRPTYVWMCVLYRVPKRGFWRQKRRQNVTCKESLTGGYGDNSAGKMFLRIYFQTQPRWQTNICIDVCNCAKSCRGGYDDKSAGQMFLRIYVHTRAMRQTNVCMDVCILQSPEPRAMATKAPAKCFLYRIVCTGGYGDKSAGQMVPRIYVTTKAADQHRYGCVYQISTPNMV